MTKAGRAETKSIYQNKHIAENYNQRRFSGSGGQWVNDQEINIITRIIDRLKLPNKLILDVGAGKGRLTIPLKNNGFIPYALDASKEMVGELRKHLKPSQIWIRSAFEPIKTNNEFGVITSLRFFDHFDARDINIILSNFKKAMHREGYMIFSGLNKNSLEAILAPWFYYGRINYFYSDREYRAMFAKAGFEIKEKKTQFIFPRGVFIRTRKGLIVLEKLLQKLFPYLGANCVYVLTAVRP